MRTPAQTALLNTGLAGGDPDPADTCATIETEAELQGYLIGMTARGVDVRHAVMVRRKEIQMRKGVRGADRP